MRAGWKCRRAPGGGPGGGRARGFTLSEFALTLLVAGLMGGLGLQLASRVLRRGRVELLAREMQGFAQVFLEHRRVGGAWPPSTTGQVLVPRGMEKALEGTAWSVGSPFGGNYGWIAPATARPGGAGDRLEGRGLVTLTAFSPAFPLALARREWLELDRRLDDGDPATGRLRTGFNGWPVYVVTDRP